MSNNSELEEWGIQISPEAFEMETRTMIKPMIMTGQFQNEFSPITNKASYTQRLLEPVDLQENRWALAYDVNDYDNANLL